MKLIKVFIVSILVFTIVSCGKKDDSTVVNLWNPFSGPDGKVFNKMVEDFNVQYKGKITIKVQTTPNDGNAYYNKIKTTMANKSKLPDMAVMHIDQMPSYAANDVLKEFSAEDFSKAGVNTEDYFQNVWAASSYNGKQYSLPFDIHPMVLWINKDLIKEEQIPKSYDELVSLSESYNKDKKFAFAMPNNPFVINRVLYGAMLQNNTQIINEEGTKVLYNSPEGTKSLDKMVDFSQNKKLNPKVGDDVVNLFKAGEVGMTIEGIWMKNGFEEAKLNVEAIPMSSLFGDTKASWASAHTFVQFDNGNNKTNEILTIVKYFNENNLKWLNTGKLPVTNSTLNSAEFQKMPLESKLAQNMEEYVFYPNVITSEALWLPIERNANEAYLGKITTQKALENAEKEGNAKAAEVLK